MTLSATDSTATLANGVVTAVIEKATGKVTRYTLNGTQILDTSGCVYSATVSTMDMVDMVDIWCKRTWNSTVGYKLMSTGCCGAATRGSTDTSC